MAKLKVGDTITIRNKEFTICSEKKTSAQTYYFLSQGARDLLQTLGITDPNSTMRICPTKGHKTCAEDEYALAIVSLQFQLSW